MANFNYNNYNYPIIIIKKNNRNTYLRVKNKEIIITTNYFTSDKIINSLIENNKESLIKMIKADNIKQEKNNNFYLWGISYNIIYGNCFNKIELNNNKIYVKDQKELDKYIKKEIINTFTTHLNYWYNEFEEKIPVPNLVLRKMSSRWGVCNLKNNNVTLNTELYKYDIKCLDYVIIHELSHFMFPNHSPYFWNLVSKYCSDYKKLRNKLKK